MSEKKKKSDEEIAREAEAMLRAAIEAGLEEGWFLKQGVIREVKCVGSGDYQEVCGACALGMLVRDVPIQLEPFVDYQPAWDAAAQRLGFDSVSDERFNDIWKGFDGYGMCEGNEFRNLGARLRRDYFEMEEAQS